MSAYQNASITRYGNRAAHDRIATARIDATLQGADVRLAVKLVADTTSGAILTVRAQDVRLLADAFTAAAQAIERR